MSNAAANPSSSPVDAYRRLVDAGTIRADPAQESAVLALQRLAEQLTGYRGQMGKQGWAARLGIGSKPVPLPKGLYMWGGVGRGKSMLMDVFFENVPVDAKQHVHFHSFLQEVHRRVHAFREAQKLGKVPESKDPLPALARVIVGQAWLLCFDEFHVTDIADAMILGRLFQELFEQGVVIVATSNRAPNDLYRDGLQRERFLPFIGLIAEKMDIMELKAAEDYRLIRLKGMEVYLTPADVAAKAKLEAGFHDLTLGVEMKSILLDVNGRALKMPKTAEGAAFASFEELCAQPLGPGDFLAIAERFHTLFLDGVPKLGPANRNEAKRFVTLIDALYEAKVNLVCSAAVPPTELYTEGDGAFEFERTVSRLIEMQSADYMAMPHRT
ncbi:MAG: cell division protein ZapE [Proteobacteria bacterium]|nr:cell division protein ZapE [Pseudomonadota bacterium]